MALSNKQRQAVAIKPSKVGAPKGPAMPKKPAMPKAPAKPKMPAKPKAPKVIGNPQAMVMKGALSGLRGL